MKAKYFLLFLSMILVSGIVTCQETDSTNYALLIVDIQMFYFPDEANPGLVNAEEASLKAKEVLRAFREHSKLVIHVQHKSNKGFEIHKNVAPREGEKIIVKEHVNSFQETDLLEYLTMNKITDLVVIGMQTHMCLEGAVRAARDYGFGCIVVEDACATRNLKFGDRLVKAEDVHSSTLTTLVEGGYAKVLNLESFLQEAIVK